MFVIAFKGFYTGDYIWLHSYIATCMQCILMVCTIFTCRQCSYIVCVWPHYSHHTKICIHANTINVTELATLQLSSTS